MKIVVIGATSASPSIAAGCGSRARPPTSCWWRVTPPRPDASPPTCGCAARRSTVTVVEADFLDTGGDRQARRRRPPRRSGRHRADRPRLDAARAEAGRGRPRALPRDRWKSMPCRRRCSPRPSPASSPRRAAARSPSSARSRAIAAARPTIPTVPARALLARYAEGLEHRFAGSGVSGRADQARPDRHADGRRTPGAGRAWPRSRRWRAPWSRGIDAARPVVYAPAHVALIMLIVRHMPRFIFNRLNL